MVGAGTLGCLVAWLLGQIPGVATELIDINVDKRSVAHELGVGFALPGEATPQADLVVHCSATQTGLTTALELARLRGSGGRNELVWRSTGIDTTGRGFPCEAVVHLLFTGGHGSDRAARALERAPAHGIGASVAERPGPGRSYYRRGSFRITAVGDGASRHHAR